MTTVDHEAPESPSYCYYSKPRAGFSDPHVARQAALIFRAAGITADLMRDGVDPEDGLLTRLVEDLSALEAEGIDATRAQGMLRHGESPVPCPRPAPDGALSVA